ncbi:MAG: hypothetical protein AB7S38_28995 [Vulcanimicrobiota bacterium]
MIRILIDHLVVDGVRYERGQLVDNPSPRLLELAHPDVRLLGHSACEMVGTNKPPKLARPAEHCRLKPGEVQPPRAPEAATNDDAPAEEPQPKAARKRKK